MLKRGSRLRKFGCLLGILLVVSGISFRAGRYSKDSTETGKGVAIVDSYTISQKELDRYLPIYRRRATLDLIEMRLIAAEAWHRKIQGSTKHQYPKGTAEQVDFVAAGPYLWGKDIFQQLILLDWSESKRDECLKLLKDELVEYEVAFFIVRSDDDLPALKVEIKDGMDFNSLNARYGSPDLGDEMLITMSERRESLARRFRCNLGDMEAAFGAEMAVLISNAAPGDILGPIRHESLSYTCSLKARNDKPADLQRLLRSRIVDSQQAKTLAKLFNKAQVTVAPELGGDLEELEKIP